MTHPFQWALFIGPAWHPSTSPYFWDWTGLAADGASTLDYQSTLSSTLSSGVTSAVLTSAASFPSAGGVWIGPNGSGQAWEYCDYSGKSSNTLTGLVREPTADREHNGVHNSGAVIRPWWKVAGDDGQLRVDMSLDNLLVATEWQYQISGIAAPQAAFRPFHLAVIQYRLAVTGSLLNMFVGFLDASTIRDDAKRIRNWSARTGSLANLLKRITVEGVRVGDFDAVQHGSARSSTPLGAAHKERWTGDFVAASPSFAADGVLDDENDGIWINDRMVGTDEPPGTFDGISQIYINPPLSVNAGTRWIEFINHDTASVELLAWNRDTATEVGLVIPSVTLADGERMIIAENAARFLEENPSQQATQIFDVSGGANPGWFNNLKVAGGALAFNFFGSKTKVVYWGDISDSDTSWSATGWTGASMAVPGADETMRYKMLDDGHANTKDDWEISRRQSPGYTIEDNNLGEQAWIAVDLPTMGLVLHEDITDSTPGAAGTLLIDGQNGPSTDGLPSSGTLVLGDEYITYSAKVTGGVTVTARGASGTTAAAHVAGDAVYVVFTQASRTTITDALPLKQLIWERSGGTIYLRDFKWRYSALKARTPDEEQHEDDYEVTNTVTSHATSSHTQNLTDNRARTVLLEIQKMTTDPARPRVNRLKALVDPAYFASGQWLSSGETVEQLIRQIGLNAGMAGTIVTATGGGATPGGFVTALDSAWSVMASAAEMGGSQIIVSRDGKVNAAPDDFWTEAIGGYTPVETWTRSNASSVELIRTGGAYVSQVKITWETPDGSDGGVAIWPTTPADLGAVQELGPYYFATEAGAILAARKRFYLSRYPYELAVTLAAGNLDIEPRQVHSVQWQLADDMQVIDRRMLVRQVQHYVEGQTLGTVLYGIVMDRESDG